MYSRRVIHANVLLPKEKKNANALKFNVNHSHWHLFCFHPRLLPHRNKMELLWFNCVYFGIDLGVMLYVRNFMTLLSCSCRECSPEKKPDPYIQWAIKCLLSHCSSPLGKHIGMCKHIHFHTPTNIYSGNIDSSDAIITRSRCGKKKNANLLSMASVIGKVSVEIYETFSGFHLTKNEN